jgi:hypothetical protein
VKRRAGLLLSAFLIFVSLVAASCRNSENAASIAPRISIHPATSGQAAYVDVTGLSSTELAALRSAGLSSDGWRSLLRISVAGVENSRGLPAVLGRYVVTASSVTFTPAFPFDPGRAYHVTFDPSAPPLARKAAATDLVVSLPAAEKGAPSTTVTAVYPGGSELAENTLRLYIEFSAPMGNAGALDYVRLVDADGRDVAMPFLPVQTDFWNADHTRYTLFFDPGRVKQGILPNEQMGRPLRAGHRYRLEVSAAWRDAGGQPLKADYRHDFAAGPARLNPLTPSAWRIEPPGPGTRDPLIVRFPQPLDHGLLGRALAVESDDGRMLDGQVVADDDDTRWSFRPAAAWIPGVYRVAVLAVLEDPSGNRIGRAFEVDMKVVRGGAAPDVYRVPFKIVGSSP